MFVSYIQLSVFLPFLKFLISHAALSSSFFEISKLLKIQDKTGQLVCSPLLKDGSMRIHLNFVYFTTTFFFLFSMYTPLFRELSELPTRCPVML